MKYVSECINSSWISSRGKFVSEFEKSFSNAVKVEHATSVCNGTVALHLALVALGIGPGDEVIVPTLTYIASVNAIVYCGAKPIFVDSSSETWQIDPDSVIDKITPNTKAIMAVHLYGQACDMDALLNIAKKHKLFLVEDCAEAFGTYYKNKHVGTFGNISTFSFFGNKTITTGEGGMVVSNDKTLIERARHFKGQGLAEHRQYWHDVVGYNYRMTNIQAAIGLAQLERSANFISRKREIADLYKNLLSSLPLDVHREALQTVHSYWMTSILLEDPNLREPLREKLSSAGIETRPLFYPVHTMPMYAKSYERFPVAESLAWRGINLPSYPGLSNEQVDYVCQKINSFFKDLN